MNFLKRIISNKSSKKITGNAEFWTWFSENEVKLFNTIKTGTRVPEEFIESVHAKLNELRDRSYFLSVGMLDDDTAELVISAEGVIKNFVFVEDLVKVAPVLDRWTFTPLKPAIETKNVGIRMGDIDFNRDNIKFYPIEVEGYPDLISLKITHEDFTEERKNLISNGVYIYLDHVLGEKNFSSIVDEFEVVAESSLQNHLIPIEKTNDYLLWRQKEFIEKYEGERKNTKDDQYALFEMTLRSGNRAVSTLNTDLLRWDRKASHPWMLSIKIEYNTKRDDGLPDDEVAEALNQIEDLFLAALKDVNGYLNVGRETGDWLREIFFACKDMEACSRVTDKIIKDYTGKLKIEYDIYKDKYWKTFEHYSIL